ncbi:MAG: alpha/beta fold hydrolase [Gemmatimonadota bacterium]
MTEYTRHVRGIELHERRAGDEGPLVPVLHGGPGAHHDYLLPGFDALARGRTLVYYDQRGGGRSPVARTVPVGWTEHVADLEALRVLWGTEQLDLLGYSWGALLAMLYAIAHPDRVRSLALVSPAPASSVERVSYEATLAARSRTPELVAAREALLASGLRERDPEAHARRLFELAVAGYFHDPARARDLTPFRVTGRTQSEVWASLGDDYDLRPQLRELHLPAIVLHGEDDPIPIASARSTAEALGAKFVSLPGAGHVPYVEAHAEFVAALDAFLPRA